MTRFRGLILASLGAASFGFAFLAKSGVFRRAAGTAASTPSRAEPEPVGLAALGFTPGRQLVAYVFVSSNCSYCQLSDTKAAIASIRPLFRRNNRDGFRSATVVGVDLDADIGVGLSYLNGIGYGSFDEISVGRAWLNENLVRLVWRDRAGPASVPQVIILSRDMSAKLQPLNLNFTTDSVVGLLTGRKAILRWVDAGATVQAAAPAPTSEAQLDTTSLGAPSTIPP